MRERDNQGVLKLAVSVAEISATQRANDGQLQDGWLRDRGRDFDEQRPNNDCRVGEARVWQVGEQGLTILPDAPCVSKRDAARTVGHRLIGPLPGVTRAHREPDFEKLSTEGR